MSAAGEVLVLFDPQSIHDMDDNLDPTQIDWGTSEKDPGREPREGRRDLRAFLMEEDGHVLFTCIGGIDRETRTRIVREVGAWTIEVDGDDPFKLPRWYQRVDLVELRVAIDRMLDEIESGAHDWDLRDWYPAPIMEGE